MDEGVPVCVQPTQLLTVLDILAEERTDRFEAER
jgi:hypothetical protein